MEDFFADGDGDGVGARGSEAETGVTVEGWGSKMGGGVAGGSNGADVAAAWCSGVVAGAEGEALLELVACCGVPDGLVTAG